MTGHSTIRFSAQRRRGVTLIEVCIAIALAAMLSAGMYGSAIYTMRQTAKNVDHLYAVQLASSEAAAIRASRFKKLSANPATLTTADYEYRFRADKTVVSDANTSHSTSYTVKYQLSGFGKGVTIDGSGPNATLKLGENSQTWAEDQYAGHLLVITGGDGVNQVMKIVSNDASQGTGNNKTVYVNLTSDISGADDDANWLGNNPDSDSEWAVDYGLYSNIEVSWDGGDGYKTVQETVYVPCSR